MSDAPHGWTLAVLTELGTVERGRSRHRPRNDPALYGGKYPFVQTGDVKAAGLRLYGYTQTYNEVGLAQSRLWPCGTLCITIAANICDTAILGIPACFPDSIVGFTANREVADVVFVKYALDFAKQRFTGISHGATQDNLSVEKLLSQHLPVPPLPEQRRIASILGAYDDLIEVNRRRIAVLEEMARRLFEEWFVHFRFPGHEGSAMVETPAGRIPEGWKMGRLDEMYETSSGGTPSRKCPQYYGGDVPWVKTKELLDGPIFRTEECITEEGLTNSSAKVFPPYTVLVAMYGANIGQLGVLTHPAATNQACCAVISKSSDSSWAYAYFMLRHARERLINLRAGAAQQNISQAVIRGFDILHPPSAICGSFERLVSPILGLSFVLHEQNANLSKQRDLLLPRLISGEISVASGEHELEAVA